MAAYWKRTVDGQEQVRTGLGWRAIVHATDDDVLDQLPVVDLSDMYNSDITKRKKVAAKICDACVKFGFFYASNYGVPHDDISMVFSEAKRFFTELTLEEKLELDTAKHSHYWGYYPCYKDGKHPAGASKWHFHEAVCVSQLLTVRNRS